MTPIPDWQLPPQLEAAFQQATALAARGEWAHAALLAERLLAAAPHCTPVLALASNASLAQARYRDARDRALQAASRPVDSPPVLIQVVRLLRRFEEPATMKRLVSRSDWRSARSPALLAELALHLGSSGLVALALDCVDVALRIAPDDSDAYYLRGLFEMFSGNTEASIAALQHSLSLHPGMANAHWLLAMQQDAGSAEAHIAQMQHALRHTRPGTDAEIYLRYALHHRLDAVGRYDAAWESLQRGLVAKRRITPYDRAAQRRLFDQVKSTELPPLPSTNSPGGGTGLIFIVGMYRSGTSLIERVLAGHPDVADGGETYQFSAAMRQAADHDCLEVLDSDIVARAPSVDFAAVGQRMQAFADWRGQGRKWLTEKLPSNFLNIGYILRALPGARIVHLRRNPVETCFSNLRTIFNGAAAYACDQSDLAHYVLLYQDLMRHWHATAPGRILDVDYASFVAQPEREAQRLMAYCNLPYLPQAVDIGRRGGTTATASAGQVRKGILVNRGEAWKPYAMHLQPLIHGLASSAGATVVDGSSLT